MKKILILLLVAMISVPDAGAQQKNWAVVNVSSCFLRAKPDYESANETQCLMGTVLEVTGSERYWRRVNAPDYRNCWTTELVLTFMDDAQKDAYIAAPKYICTTEYTHVYALPDAASPRICDLIMGDLLLRPEESVPGVSARSEGHANQGNPPGCGAHVLCGWTSVSLPSGTKGWVRSCELEDFASWAASRKTDASTLVDFALGLTGVPYMWGGNTVKHFDCSGLTKFVYMMNGIVLPRNAREQIHCGVGVPFDFEAMQPGDLVFFGSLDSNGRIRSVTHVGMYIGDTRMIHSSHLVRVNSLKDGESDSYGRKPIAVRRILGHVGEEYACSEVSVRPWYFR